MKRASFGGFAFGFSFGSKVGVAVFTAAWAGFAALVSAPAGAEERGIVETVKEGCKTELTNFCSQVTPGEGRVLACLYAHEDKLSGRCEYALYDSAARLERAVAALTFVANECSADIQKNCAGVEMGEGRILACLKEHDAEVSDRCKLAVQDVGLE